MNCSLVGLQSVGSQRVNDNLATIQHRETLGRISECTQQKPVGDLPGWFFSGVWGRSAVLGLLLDTGFLQLQQLMAAL